MSWVARKICMSDDVDQQQVIKEYFDNKEQVRLLQELLQEQEIKKFWSEYEDEYYNG